MYFGRGNSGRGFVSGCDPISAMAMTWAGGPGTRLVVQIDNRTDWGYQVRFPKSKRKRIRKKWAADPYNYSVEANRRAFFNECVKTARFFKAPMLFETQKGAESFKKYHRDPSLFDHVRFKQADENSYDGRKMRFDPFHYDWDLHFDPTPPAELWKHLRATLKDGEVVGKAIFTSTVEDTGGEDLLKLWAETDPNRETGLRRLFAPHLIEEMKNVKESEKKKDDDEKI